MKTFSLEVCGATIDSCYTKNKVALCFNAEPAEVAGLLTIEEVVKMIGYGELLDVIGEEKVREYFGIVTEEA